MRAVIALILAAAAASSASAQEAPEVATLDGEKPRRMLFVGNSYLYYGDSIHNHVIRMARAAYPDEEFAYRSATISGSRLDFHDLGSLLEPGRLGYDEPFDTVILQGHSRGATEAERPRFEAAVSAMDATIDDYGARTVLYMTPAYTEVHERFDPTMMGQIDEGYTSAGNAADALVIPVGLAFDLAYERRPEIELHKAFDGSHPTLLGTYLAAATTFAALYEAPAVGNPYDYYGAVPAEDAAFLQQVAEDAVAQYHARPDTPQ